MERTELEGVFVQGATENRRKVVTVFWEQVAGESRVKCVMVFGNRFLETGDDRV